MYRSNIKYFYCVTHSCLTRWNDLILSVFLDKWVRFLYDVLFYDKDLFKVSTFILSNDNHTFTILQRLNISTLLLVIFSLLTTNQQGKLKMQLLTLSLHRKCKLLIFKNFRTIYSTV